MKMKGGKVKTLEVKKFVESSYKDKKTAPKKIGDYILDEKLSNKKVKVYHDPKHDKTVVANRGTASTISDWTNNLRYGADVATGNVFNLYNKSDRFQQAKKTQKEALRKYGKVDTNIGHSQSGVITRKLNEKGLTNQVININPAGFFETPKKNEYSYRSTFDPVSSFTTGAKTASDFILNPIKAHSSEFLNTYHKKYLGGSIDELKQEANDPEIIAKAKDYINQIIDSNYKDYIIKAVEDYLNYDRDEKIIKYIMFKENLKIFDLLYPNQRYLYEDNKPKGKAPKKEKVVKEKKPKKEKPIKDDTRTPAEKRKETMAKKAQLLKIERIKTMNEKALMIIKQINDSNFNESLYPLIRTKIDTYAMPQLVKDTIMEKDPKIYKELYPIKKKKEINRDEPYKRLTRKELKEIANQKIQAYEKEKEIKLNKPIVKINKPIKDNINELIDNIKNTNINKKSKNININEIETLINKIDKTVKNKKTKKNKILELIDKIKNTNIKDKIKNIDINEMNILINKIDNIMKKNKQEKDKIALQRWSEAYNKKYLGKTHSQLKKEKEKELNKESKLALKKIEQSKEGKTLSQLIKEEKNRMIKEADNEFLQENNKYVELLNKNSSLSLTEKQILNAINQLYTIRQSGTISDDKIKKWGDKYGLTYKSNRIGSRNSEYINKQRKEYLDSIKKLFFSNI